jgi:hypothetical protein
VQIKLLGYRVQLVYRWDWQYLEAGNENAENEIISSAGFS